MRRRRSGQLWNCLFSRRLSLPSQSESQLTKTPPIHPDMFNLLLPLPSNTDLTFNPSSSYHVNFLIYSSPSSYPCQAFVLICLHPPHPQICKALSCLDWWVIGAKLISTKPFSDPVQVGNSRQSKLASDQTKLLLPLLSCQQQLNYGE